MNDKLDYITYELFITTTSNFNKDVIMDSLCNGTFYCTFISQDGIGPTAYWINIIDTSIKAKKIKSYKKQRKRIDDLKNEILELFEDKIKVHSLIIYGLKAAGAYGTNYASFKSVKNKNKKIIPSYLKLIKNE